MKKFLSNNRRRLTIVVLFCLFISKSFSQDVNYQGALIYHFANLFHWPTSENFTIGVMGECPISKVLDQIALTKKVGNATITIKKVTSVNSLSGCNIVFICDDHIGELSNVARYAKENRMLVVTYGTGLANKGAGISFVKQDDKISYELNPSNIATTGLEVPALIKKMAKVIFNS